MDEMDQVRNFLLVRVPILDSISPEPGIEGVAQ